MSAAVRFDVVHHIRHDTTRADLAFSCPFS